jgi:hypothetical protein
MRFFIGTQVGKQTVAAATVWELGARKSLRRKRSLREQLATTAREVSVTDAQGRSATRLAFEIPASTYEVVFGRTTRGLYFFHTGRILDPAAPIKVAPLTTAPDKEFLSDLNVNEIGGAVCRYWYGIAAGALDASVWAYCFHDLHWVYVATGEACEFDDV